MRADPAGAMSRVLVVAHAAGAAISARAEHTHTGADTFTLPGLLPATPRVPRPSPPPCTARARAGHSLGLLLEHSAPRVESLSRFARGALPVRSRRCASPRG
eukprot:1228758-Prymnesium_polylepis.1